MILKKGQTANHTATSTLAHSFYGGAIWKYKPHVVAHVTSVYGNTDNDYNQPLIVLVPITTELSGRYFCSDILSCLYTWW